MLQANGWKGAGNVTFNLLRKLLLEIELYNFFASIDNSISFFLNCGFLHFVSDVYFRRG